MEFDITQWWVPAVAMLLLGLYIARSFISEYRLPEPAAPVASRSLNDPVPAAAEGGGAPEEDAPAEKKKKKRGLLFRTSWIWGSLLIGALAQLYLEYFSGVTG